MSVEEKDKYDKALEEKKELLQKCQESKELKSCMQCELLLECDTRKTYVVAVYESMSKGQGGGFEF